MRGFLANLANTDLVFAVGVRQMIGKIEQLLAEKAPIVQFAALNPFVAVPGRHMIGEFIFAARARGQAGNLANRPVIEIGDIDAIEFVCFAARIDFYGKCQLAPGGSPGNRVESRVIGSRG